MSMSSQIDALLKEYFDDNASPEVCAEIESWLRKSPENPRILAGYLYTEELIYAEQEHMDVSAVYAMLQELEDSASAEVVVLDSKETSIRTKTASHEPTRHAVGDYVNAGVYLLELLTRKTVMSVSIAAALAVSVGLYFLFSSEDIPETANDSVSVPELVPSVVTLREEYQAIWANTNSIELGTGFSPGQVVELKSGYAGLVTNHGAKLILEAPCTVEMLDDDNAIRLISGKLSGIVETNKARGLIVRTPNMSVTDLGTRFGVIAEPGVTRVHVGEGSVTVKPANGGDLQAPALLNSGDSAQVEEHSTDIIILDDMPDRFAYSWNAIATRPQVEGNQVEFMPVLPESTRIGKSESNKILLFPEKESILLEKDLAVTFSDPDKYTTFESAESMIARGMRIDSYLLHFDPPGAPTERKVRRATIRFDSPILGIIATREDLIASQSEFAIPEVIYGNDGLEANLQGKGDEVNISNDRKVLRVTLRSTTGIDQLRVLISSD